MSGTKSAEKMNNKKCTSCEQNLEHTKTNDIGADNVPGNTDKDLKAADIVSNVEKVQTCANCGKEGANNTCNKCEMVKYCNATCKKKHRSKHKNDCEEHLRRAAALQEEEIKRAAELRDIELFKQPPQQEEDDCPICFQRLPFLGSGMISTGKRYQSCCGKVICSGCVHAMDKICAFCRTPEPKSSEEIMKRVQKRVDAGDAQAMNNLGNIFHHGGYGLPRDHTKALELWKQAAELGYSEAYHNIGVAYQDGYGVKRDKKKAAHYEELAAMGGVVISRHNLGLAEQKAGNVNRALKHYVLALEGGYKVSLNYIQRLYSNGDATKDDYTKALRAYQKYLDEVKSSQRDKAAAANEGYKYIE